jgi:hypothetical protein
MRRFSASVRGVLLRFVGRPSARRCDRLRRTGEKKTRQQQKQTHTTDISKAHFATPSFKIGLHHSKPFQLRSVTRAECPSKT